MKDEIGVIPYLVVLSNCANTGDPTYCPTITPNGSSCNGNTFPGTFDALGRFFFARLTAQF